jgi:hypothetical protein
VTAQHPQDKMDASVFQPDCSWFCAGRSLATCAPKSAPKPEETNVTKLVVVAALLGSLFVVPVLPVSAAPMTAAQKDCLVFPMLKKQCWEMGARTVSETVAAAPRAVAMAAEDVATEVIVPMWGCTPAPRGSGHLLKC